MENDELLQICDSLGILKQLENRGYIVRENEEVIFTEKALNELKTVSTNSVKTVTKTESVEDWIDEFRNLFPKGIVSGGYLVKGDRRACILKMEKFLKLYPNYTKETILQATRNYIERKEREGFKYMQLAHYFILKDKTSTLAGECEAIVDNSSDLDENPFERTM